MKIKCLIAVALIALVSLSQAGSMPCADRDVYVNALRTVGDLLDEDRIDEARKIVQKALEYAERQDDRSKR